MLLELKIGIIAIIIFAIYMIILYFTNRNLCKKIVHKIMIEVEILSKSSIVKQKRFILFQIFTGNRLISSKTTICTNYS